MSRVWRRRLWRCASIFIAVVSVLATVVALHDQRWLSALGWALTLALAVLDLVWRRTPINHRLGRWKAKETVPVAEATLRALRRQREAHLEVWDQITWHISSVEQQRDQLVEIAEGRQRATSDELDLMWNRLSVDATPVLEQDYVDQPSALGWLLLRLSRRDARKVGDA